jgi:hypothetical protein
MTLHEAVEYFRWDATHDYGRAARRSGDGKIAALYGLGLYESDLERLQQIVPALSVTLLRRVVHDHGVWFRVDVKEAPW